MSGAVCIVGAGAVGRSLGRALVAGGVPLSADRDAAPTVLLAVPDDQVGVVAADAAARGLALPHQVWLHCSGRLGAGALDPVAPLVAGTGAFHPAFVFPPGRETDLPRGVGFGVDCRGAARERAAELAAALGGFVVEVPAADRTAYHAAAVLASNCVVALISAARDALAGRGVPAADAERLLATLARGAVRSVLDLGAEAALTGPIRRGDAAAVAAHLSALEAAPDARALYVAASRSALALATRDPAFPPDAAAALAALLDPD
jgi:predicted short-subunit dehydrogenase-like oxidoreductase (DUF2520 family)